MRQIRSRSRKSPRVLSDIPRALWLIVTADPEVWAVAAVSLQVATSALILALLVGVPLGYALGSKYFRGRDGLRIMVHTLMALPTVVVGLTLYFAFSNSGPLGSWRLLYTRLAIVLGEWILATPIVAALTATAIEHIPREAQETLRSLGLHPIRRAAVLLREVRGSLLAASMVAFARVFTELGAAVILGGNIRGKTRTLTTVIALEHSKGEDVRSWAFGIILLTLALGVNAAVHRFGWSARKGSGA